MEEQVNEKVIAIYIKVGKLTTELTAEVLQKALKSVLSQMKKRNGKLKQGKQTLKQLRKHGAALSNIEITEKNIKAFSRVAKEFEIDFALKKDVNMQPQHYIVFFKGKDEDTMQQAFKKFTHMKLNKEMKPSIRKTLAAFKEKAKQMNQNRQKVKSKDWGRER